MNRVLAKTARIEPGDRILDAGCGIGGSSLWLAEHFSKISVMGININEMQIEIANKHVRQQQLQSSVKFRVADFVETGLPSASFDVVWALESMCYGEHKQDFLKESFRVLKPGGRLVIADGFLTREDLNSQEQNIVSRWCRGWAIPNVVSVERFREHLNGVGFQKIQFQDVTQQVTPSSKRIYIGSLLFYPLGVLLCWLGLRSEIQTRGIASGYYQYIARKRGLGVYGIWSAEK